MAETEAAPFVGTEQVALEVRDGVLWVTFTRPEVLNAVNGAMMQTASEAVEAARSREDIGAVVITGTGAGFSAGADMESLHLAPQFPHETMDGANRLIRAIVAIDKPVVAAVNGVAAGVACGAALVSDLIIAAESASFLLPFTKLGLMTDGGSSLTVAASIGRARAMRMALLAEPMSAREALETGLITHVVPDDELVATASKLATRLAAGPRIAHAAVKKAINAATLPDLEEALAREHSGQRTLFRTADFTEGLAAFAERRRPVFRGE
ncbi:enoyl-CoA hydratase [Nocardioides fonticola]|uniref:Enoyl-CoA hydratase n=1 Tax=Nocardioides fonticola TaxID=450363 RepID=A0ABP7XHN1_9ACTN